MERPLDVLKRSLNGRVIVAMRDGREHRGTLAGYDPHLNLLLGNSEEWVGGEKVRRWRRTVLRGDSVIYVSP